MKVTVSEFTTNGVCLTTFSDGELEYVSAIELYRALYTGNYNNPATFYNNIKKECGVIPVAISYALYELLRDNFPRVKVASHSHIIALYDVMNIIDEIRPMVSSSLPKRRQDIYDDNVVVSSYTINGINFDVFSDKDTEVGYIAAVDLYSKLYSQKYNKPITFYRAIKKQCGITPETIPENMYESLRNDYHKMKIQRNTLMLQINEVQDIVM